jgi:hypothetical protein
MQKTRNANTIADNVSDALANTDADVFADRIVFGRRLRLAG